MGQPALAKKSCGDTAGLIQHQNSPEYQLVTVFPLCGECAKNIWRPQSKNPVVAFGMARAKKSCGDIGQPSHQKKILW